MTAEDFEAVIPLVVLAFKARFIAVELTCKLNVDATVRLVIELFIIG